MVQPTFIAIAAITLDGKIAKDSNHLSDWTSKEDKLFLHALLDKCDAIIVGNNTYKTAIKPLSKRNCIVFSRSTDKPINQTPKLTYVNPDKSNVKKLIAKFGYKTVAILGGAQTYAYCLENKMLDELYLTIEPIVFGKGINLFTPSPVEGRVACPPKLERRRKERLQDYEFKLLSAKKLNKQGSLLLHYKK